MDRSNSFLLSSSGDKTLSALAAFFFGATPCSLTMSAVFASRPSSRALRAALFLGTFSFARRAVDNLETVPPWIEHVWFMLYEFQGVPGLGRNRNWQEAHT